MNKQYIDNCMFDTIGLYMLVFVFLITCIISDFQKLESELDQSGTNQEYFQSGEMCNAQKSGYCRFVDCQILSNQSNEDPIE